MHCKGILLPEECSKIYIEIYKSNYCKSLPRISIGHAVGNVVGSREGGLRLWKVSIMRLLNEETVT